MPGKNQNPNPKAVETRPLTPLEKIILALSGVVILIAGIFLAGRFMTPVSTTPNPFNLSSQALSMETAPVSISPLQLGMINFGGVSPMKIDMVMMLYNMKKCPCGCNMSIAECIVKDPNCPMWKGHVLEIQKALGNGKNPNLGMGGHAGLTVPGTKGFGLP